MWVSAFLFTPPKQFSPDMVVYCYKFQRKTASQNEDHSGCFRAVSAPMLRRSVLAVRELIFLMTTREEVFKSTKERNKTIEISFLH